MAYATQDLKAGNRVNAARIEKAGIELATGNYQAAALTYASCLDLADDDGLRCANGYLVAKYLMGENAVADVLTQLGSRADDLATSDNIHALALAVFLQKMKGNELKPAVMKVMRVNLGKPLAAIQSADGFYYLGLLGLIAKNADFARENFTQSAASRVAKPERLFSALWLKKL